MRKYDLIIFDLDGTVLDTLGDLTAACNHTMRAFGFPEYEAETVRTFIGSGIANLISLAVPEGTSKETQSAATDVFKSYYADHSRDLTAPFPGIPELMEALRSSGIHVAVNSNKLDSATRGLCSHYFGDLVEYAVGERPDLPKKPAPDGANLLMSEFSVPNSRTLYVGDSAIDLRTAANAGVDSAWVSWGLRRLDELDGLHPENIFHSAEALKAFIFR